MAGSNTLLKPRTRPLAVPLRRCMAVKAAQALAKEKSLEKKAKTYKLPLGELANLARPLGLHAARRAGAGRRHRLAEARQRARPGRGPRGRQFRYLDVAHRRHLLAMVVAWYLFLLLLPFCRLQRGQILLNLKVS